MKCKYCEKEHDDRIACPESMYDDVKRAREKVRKSLLGVQEKEV